MHDYSVHRVRPGAYEKRDGSLVDPSQIHARANKYQAMFEKDGRRLRLSD